MQKEEIFKILEGQYFGDHPHERAENEAVRGVVDESIVCLVDVGASLGQYTRTFSEMGGRRRVVAIEADPVRYERLVQNAKLWSEATASEISVLHGAVSDSEQPYEFFTTDSNVSGSCNELSERSDHWRKISVPSILLDSLLSSYDNTFVKMDIEGGEYAALVGAEKLLKGKNNSFLVELHVWGDRSRNKKVKDVLDIFYRNQYAIRKFYGHYLFDRKGPRSRWAYLGVGVMFKLKEWVYFSPLRPFAQRINSVLRNYNK